MPRDDTTSRASVFGGHPIHPMLIPFPIAFLTGVLGVDLVVAFTDSEAWADASRWLLGAGIVSGLLAAVPGIVDYLAVPAARSHRTATLHGAGNALALLVSAGNLLGRLDDPLAFIVPWGLVLSAVVGGILGLTGWWGGELSYRYRVGVVEEH